MSDDVKRPRRPHPMQPIVRATDGVIRFQKNAIVEFMWDEAAAGRVVDINAMMSMPWSQEDREQINQLTGYSVSGIPRVRAWRKRLMDREAERLAKKHPRRTKGKS